jgi:molybdopterin converting factor small subunit
VKRSPGKYHCKTYRIWGERAIAIIVKISGYAEQPPGGLKYCFDFKEGMTMKDLFISLTSHLGPDFSNSVYDKKNDKMNENMVVYINDKEIRALCYTGTLLHDGDVITIMPPL